VFCYSVNFVGNVAVEFHLLIINTMYDAVSFRTLTALFFFNTNHLHTDCGMLFISQPLQRR